MTGTAGDWVVERVVGRAHDLHGLADPDPAKRTVRVLDVAAPAIVLGSRQKVDAVDVDRAERAGVDVVRRRSGGGAVLVVPGAQAWIDLFVPAGDALWHDDVGVAAWWVGELWVAAFDRLGLGPCEIHRAGMVRTEWSDLICFSGLGPGEVMLAGRKVVGISQRRNRLLTKLQTTALIEWDPRRLTDLLDLDETDRGRARAALARAAVGLSVSGSALVDGVLDVLPR